MSLLDGIIVRIKTEEYPGYSIPNLYYDYPAHGDVSLGQSYYLAPFKDVDGDR